MRVFPFFHNLAILVINKSGSRYAVVQFCYHSYDYRPNWTPVSPITITKSPIRKSIHFVYKPLAEFLIVELVGYLNKYFLSLLKQMLWD